MLSELNKNQIIQNFQLQQTVDYHQETMKRVAHIPRRSLRKASVLIGFVERGTSLNIIFTRRAQHLKHHPGQISFPGVNMRTVTTPCYRLRCERHTKR